MRVVRYISVLLALLLVLAVSAQEREVEIEQIEIRGERLLSQTGIQRTHLDSVALHENITFSIGDILLQSTPTFIKSYGRGTTATISVRGTAPSHTKVEWNGIPLNSPMLGMVDFSLIPAFLVDDASLYNGASSTTITSGGLGGAVTLDTKAPTRQGLSLKFVQGVSSFMTFDDFLRLSYQTERWSVSTRVAFTYSRNDFPYTNYSKLPELSVGNDGSLLRKYPVERNRNGDYRDIHIMQEGYYNSKAGDRLGFVVWLTHSLRGVPTLSTDYRPESLTRASQREASLRSTLSWSRIFNTVKVDVRGGYTYTDMLYRYCFDATGDGQQMIDGIHSLSTLHSLFGRAKAEWAFKDKLHIEGSVSVAQHAVESRDKSVVSNLNETAIVGYRQAQFELSAAASVRYRPIERVGLGANLRWDVAGDKVGAPVPAAFVDVLLSKKGGLLFKASITRNHRFPTINDLYFMPSGNPDLRSESGFTYDGGLSFDTKVASDRLHLCGEATAFDSYIDNWILWRPTFKGFWTPVNIRRVHSYGFEIKAAFDAELGRGWTLAASGLFAMSRSENEGLAVTENDKALHRQLPYIPVYNASASARLSWRGWSLIYKWRYFSERYTTSSNDATPTGVVAPYFMNDLSIEKRWTWRWGSLSIRGDVNNLFGEEYETVLSHPMPGRNFGFSIGIEPHFSPKRKDYRKSISSNR